MFRIDKSKIQQAFVDFEDRLAAMPVGLIQPAPTNAFLSDVHARLTNIEQFIWDLKQAIS